MSWIVQFDPPKEPDFFVHRVGRTARAGRTGKALILLLKPELEFVDFLTVKGIPITEWKDDEMIENTTTTQEYLTREFRKLAMGDRDVMDHGVRAFVSFVRAYKCHILKHIFSFEHLELGPLAMMFGLLQLPKMPELKDSDALIGYTEMKDVDIDSIPYKNKHREKQRQKQLKIRKEQEKKKASSTSSSGRNAKKRQHQSQDSSSKDKKKKKRKRKGKNKRMVEEWNALQKEERLYKRLKKGKITKDEYERLIRGLDEEEEKRALKDGDSSGDEDTKDSSSKKRRKKKNHRYNNRKKWFRSNK